MRDVLPRASGPAAGVLAARAPGRAKRASGPLARTAGHCYGLPVFGIGVTEMILVGLVALMLFSPKELPSLIKTLAGIYGSIRRTAEQFRAQVMEAEELREPIDEIRAAYHGTKAELDGARDVARRELQRARMEVVKAQQKINEIAREEAKRAPALGDRVEATGPSEQVPAASSAPAAVPSPAPAPGAAATTSGAGVPAAPAIRSPAPAPGAVPTTSGTSVPASPVAPAIRSPVPAPGAVATTISSGISSGSGVGSGPVVSPTAPTTPAEPAARAANERDVA